MSLRNNVQTLLKYKSPKQKITCGEALQQLIAEEMFPKWQGQNSKTFMEAFDRIASQGGYIAAIYPGMYHGPLAAPMQLANGGYLRIRS